MDTKHLSALLAGLFLFTGCTTTGNPKEGGIFWSPKKADERISERQQKIQRAEEDGRVLTDQQKRLAEEKRVQTVALEQSRKKLANLDARLSRLERSIKSYEAKTRKKHQEQKDIQQRIGGLQAEIQRVRSQMQQTQGVNRAQKHKMEELNKELEFLLNMAEASGFPVQ